MTERPLTTRQLAERWQCSERHLRDMIAGGTLRAFRVGRMYRVLAAVVREMEGCQTSDSCDIEADGQRRAVDVGRIETELAEARQGELEALAGHDQMQVERDVLKEAIGEALDALYDQSVSICPRVERARTILEQVASRNKSRNSGDEREAG